MHYIARCIAQRLVVYKCSFLLAILFSNDQSRKKKKKKKKKKMKMSTCREAFHWTFQTYEVTDIFAPVTRRPPLLLVVKGPDTEFVL